MVHRGIRRAFAGAGSTYKTDGALVLPMSTKIAHADAPKFI